MRPSTWQPGMTPPHAAGPGSSPPTLAPVRQVIETMSHSLEHIVYLFAILVLFCVIFALLGMETMAYPLRDQPGRFRYDSFIEALLSVFVVLCAARCASNRRPLNTHAAARGIPAPPRGRRVATLPFAQLG